VGHAVAPKGRDGSALLRPRCGARAEEYTRSRTFAVLPLDVLRDRGLKCAFVFTEECLGVVRLDDASNLAGAGPVYTNASGATFVPTGRIFVRFRTNDDAHGREPDLRAAGFEIEHVPGFARHCACVRALEVSVAAALHGLDRLAGLPGVEQVEPQLLAPVERK
jgi:hypothetical protein